MKSSLNNYNNYNKVILSQRYKVIDDLKQYNEQRLLQYENMYYLKEELKRYINEKEFYEYNIGVYIGYDINKYGVKKFWL